MQCEECGFVSLVDKARGAHLKRVHCAFVVCDVCDKVRVFLCLLCIPLVNIHSEWDGQFIYVQGFLVIVNNDNVRLEVGDAQVGSEPERVTERAKGRQIEPDSEPV